MSDRFATIDVGSNSVLVHVAARQPDGTFRPLDDRVELTRLGEGLERTGVLSSAAMDRTVAALAAFGELIDGYGVSRVAAVGTMCLRTAGNSAEFLARVRRECGLAIEVVAGEEEARLSFLAVRSALPASVGRVAVFDVGGGSTELTFGTGATVERRVSRDIGAIRLTEAYLRSDPVTPDELARLLTDLRQAFAPLRDEPRADALVGMGGAVTNMAAVMHELTTYDPTVIQGARLDRAEVDRQLALYRQRPIAERRALPGLQPKRADVILAGAAVVSVVMETLGVDALTVSDRGIRHGLLLDRFGGG